MYLLNKSLSYSSILKLMWLRESLSSYKMGISRAPLRALLFDSYQLVMVITRHHRILSVSPLPNIAYNASMHQRGEVNLQDSMVHVRVHVH